MTATDTATDAVTGSETTPRNDSTPPTDSAQDPGAAVVAVVELGPQWPTLDPFLFCAHHDDAYPEGDGSLAPVADLNDRDMGQDFSNRDGFSMYHGRNVPGFPSHPHRGFETVTFVRKGLIDHADSLGAAARFGRGDVQWLTAGAGIQHSEMFPLVNTESDNHLELFQIWLNLPASDKFVDPYFTMLWDEQIPRRSTINDNGRVVEVTVIAGELDGITPLAPPPNSWAAGSDSDVAIWHYVLEPGAAVEVPPARSGVAANRVLYMFEGDTASVDGIAIGNDHAVQLRAEMQVRIEAGSARTEMLLLQGVPIGEPVAKYGPFVMNTEAEIRETFEHYRQTEFGGWPWASSDPTHGHEPRRFAQHVDGRRESPEDSRSD